MQWYIPTIQVLLLAALVLFADARRHHKNKKKEHESDGSSESKSRESGSKESESELSGYGYGYSNKNLGVLNPVQALPIDQIKDSAYELTNNIPNTIPILPNPTELLETTEDQLNFFVDIIFNTFDSRINSLIAASKQILLPTAAKEFSKSILGLKLGGDVGLTDVAITNGLESLHRLGNCSVLTTKNETHTTRKFSCEFGLKFVQVSSNFTIRFMERGPSGFFVATSEALSFKLELCLIIGEIGDIKIELGQFGLDSYLPFKFNVHEFATFKTKWLQYFINPVVAKLFEKLVVGEIGKKVEELFRKVIGEINPSSILQQLWLPSQVL